MILTLVAATITDFFGLLMSLDLGIFTVAKTFLSPRGSQYELGERLGWYSFRRIQVSESLAPSILSLSCTAHSGYCCGVLELVCGLLNFL